MSTNSTTGTAKTATKWDLLARPFDADAIRWKPQSVVGPDFKKAAKTAGKYPDGCKAKFLAYIDARDVMNRLDTVLGVECWADSYTVLTQTPWTVECTLTVTVDGEAIAKTDVGYCNDPKNDTPDKEPAKAAYSDALKRTAVKFGVGRFLYDMPDTGWIAVDKYGKPTVAITSHEVVCTAGAEMLDVIRGEAKTQGVSDEDLAVLLDLDYQVTALEHLTMAQAKHLIGNLNKPRRAPEPPVVEGASKADLAAVIESAKASGHTAALKAFFTAHGGANLLAWQALSVSERENAAAIAAGALTEGAVA